MAIYLRHPIQRTYSLYFRMITSLYNFSNKDDIQVMCRDPLIIAHRGNSSEMPENTLAAFDSALSIGAHMLELDVQLTKDEIPIVLHDPDLRRTTTAPHSIPVSEMQLEMIQTYETTYWREGTPPQKVPTLERVLMEFGNSIDLMIEIKGETVDDLILVDCVSRILDRDEVRRLKKKLFVGAINPAVLRLIKERLPNFPVIAILEDFIPHHYPNADIYALDYRLLSPWRLKDLKNRGAKIWVWTVDDPMLGKALIQMGVDGLITNRPKSFVREPSSQPLPVL